MDDSDEGEIFTVVVEGGTRDCQGFAGYAAPLRCDELKSTPPLVTQQSAKFKIIIMPRLGEPSATNRSWVVICITWGMSVCLSH